MDYTSFKPLLSMIMLLENFMNMLLVSFVLVKCSLFSFPHVNLKVTKVFNAQLWHYRLGYSHIEKACTLNLSCDITSKFHISCVICPMTKQTKLPFAMSETKSIHSFDLVPLDIWRPYHIHTFNGCKYFRTIVDDYSKYT